MLVNVKNLKRALAHITYVWGPGNVKSRRVVIGCKGMAIWLNVDSDGVSAIVGVPGNGGDWFQTRAVLFSDLLTAVKAQGTTFVAIENGGENALNVGPYTVAGTVKDEVQQPDLTWATLIGHAPLKPLVEAAALVSDVAERQPPKSYGYRLDDLFIETNAATNYWGLWATNGWIARRVNLPQANAVETDTIWLRAAQFARALKVMTGDAVWLYRDGGKIVLFGASGLAQVAIKYIDDDRWHRPPLADLDAEPVGWTATADADALRAHLPGDLNTAPYSIPVDHHNGLFDNVDAQFRVSPNARDLSQVSVVGKIWAQALGPLTYHGPITICGGTDNWTPLRVFVGDYITHYVPRAG